MTLDQETCRRALAAHDSRFDGIFFVGVSSTGIYCRPVCPAKTPKPENCTFYGTHAAAEAAGYRPCLRCRPEIAPGRSNVDAVQAWAKAAVRRIEEGALAEQSIAELAEEMGISERHLRRVVQTEFGVSPIALGQTQRLLTAKQLLADTHLSVGEIAFASGFKSLRRFNALFVSRYGFAPSRIRKRTKQVSDTIICDLAYRPPFNWEAMLRFLEGRAATGVEAVIGNAYMRTVQIKNHAGWVAVVPHPSKAALRVRASSVLAPVLPPLLARLKRLFDLAAEPHRIQEALGDLAKDPGLRVPGAFDGYEIAVRAILGQQVSVHAASVIAGKFAMAFGEPAETPYAELTRFSPSPASVALLQPEQIAETGIIRSRANAIVELARAVVAKQVVLRPGADVEATMAGLCALPGIGPWTAEYISMRALAWPDAFPSSDLGIRKALGMVSAGQAEAIAEAWRPWRSYAAMHLWSTL